MWLAAPVRFAGLVTPAALAVLAGVVALTSVPSPLRAQDFGSSLSVHGSLALGGYWSDESFNGNGLSFGGALDYFPIPVLGLELGIDGGGHSRDFESGVAFEGSTVHVSANAIVRIGRSRLQPYLIGGIGLLHSSLSRSEPEGETFESEDDSLVGNLGLGLFYFIGPNVSIRPEIRAVGYDGSSPVSWYYRASLGIGYHF